MIRLTPRLEVSTTGPIAVNYAGVSYTPGLYAVESLRITWGRESLSETSATPATVTLTVLDRSPGRALAGRRDLMGRLVRITYTTDPTGLDNPVGTLFYGRINYARVAPAGRDPLNDGWIVTISASSREVDLANIEVTESWPAETFGARYSRMVALLPDWWDASPVLPTRSDVGLPSSGTVGLDTLMSYACAPLDTDGADLWSLWQTFYASLTAFPMYFDPALGTLSFSKFVRDEYVFRQVVAGTFTAGLQQTPDSGGRWRIVRTGASDLGIDAGRTLYDRASGLQQSADSAVTRVGVHYFDGAASYAEKSYGLRLDPVLERTIGSHLWSIDTVHGSRDAAVQLAGWYADVARGEMRLPLLDKIKLSSAAEPFQSLRHGQWVLQTVQSNLPAFVNGSWFALLGHRPSLVLIGGTVTYSKGEWTSEAQPVLVPRTEPPSPNVYAPLRIADVNPQRTIALRDIERCVRIADLRHIDVLSGAAQGKPYPGNPTP